MRSRKALIVGTLIVLGGMGLIVFVFQGEEISTPTTALAVETTTTNVPSITTTTLSPATTTTILSIWDTWSVYDYHRNANIWFGVTYKPRNWVRLPDGQVQHLGHDGWNFTPIDTEIGVWEPPPWEEEPPDRDSTRLPTGEEMQGWNPYLTGLIEGTCQTATGITLVGDVAFADNSFVADIYVYVVGNDFLDPPPELDVVLVNSSAEANRCGEWYEVDLLHLADFVVSVVDDDGIGVIPIQLFTQP